MNLIKKYFNTIAHECTLAWNTLTPVKRLREFGLIVGMLILALSGFLIVIHTLSPVLLGMAFSGGMLVILGVTIPRVLRRVYALWMILALILGTLISPLILLVLYAIAVTPIGILQRVFSSDPLARRFIKETPSYFLPHEEKTPRHMERPF